MSKTPSKRKNNEKRKEKSRVAARCRRNREQHIFQELTDALPVRREDVEQLDKASVMRLAIAHLRLRDVLCSLPELSIKEAEAEKQCPLKAQESYLQALDGFVFVISQLGDVIYCSDNVAEHLGVSQLEITGQSIFEFSHPADHDELRDVLRARATPARRVATFPLRLKCTLTGRGRSVHLKSASYKVVQFTGHVITQKETSAELKKLGEANKVDDCEKVAQGGALVAVGRPIPHPANIEIPLDNTTFLTKHSLDMKFTYFDEVLEKRLGFDCEELVGQSLYEHQHAADASVLAHHFKTLFSKGQCETGRYRFLAKSGGYAWVQTQATLITDKQQRPISVVCVNFFISGIECRDEVFSANQMRHADLKPAPQAAPLAPKLVETRPVPPAVSALPIYRAPKPVQTLQPKIEHVPNGAIVEEVPLKTCAPPATIEEARPRPATAYIFAPRTKDMNKGYLTFSEDDPGLTMLKDEPEDLTHLAPTAGDACIPLEDSPFDMFDEFILNDNYCSLLSEELANGSPVDSLGTDSLLISSPEPQESDSSCEQSSLLTELSLDGLDGGRSEGELDGRAPYIPMSGSDELPLLTPEVMWGAHPDSVSLARPAPAVPQQQNVAMPHPSASSLQRLLVSPPHTGPPPQDIITNIYADQGLIPGGGVTTWDTGVKRSMRDAEELNAKRSKRTAPTTPTLSPAPAVTPAAVPSSSVLMNLLDTSTGPPHRYHKIVNSTLSFIPANFQCGDSPPNLSSQTTNFPNSTPGLPLQSLNPLSPLSLNLGSPILGSPGSSMSNSTHSPMFRNPQSPMFNSPASPQTAYTRQLSMSPTVYNRLTGSSLSPGSSMSNSPHSPIFRNPQSPMFNNPLSPQASFSSESQMMSPLAYNSFTVKGFSRGSVTPHGVSPKMSHNEILQSGRDPFFANGMLSPKNYPMDTGTVLERDKLYLERAGSWDPGDVFQDNSLLAVFDDPEARTDFCDQI